MPLSIKRIFKDYENYKESDLQEQGLYCILDENNMYNMKAMVVGPKDTPYEGGFYFFTLKFPKDYPFSPPQILFCTLDRRVRFNPNYYKCGKVCLSILGTWSGPRWTGCMTLSTILLILQTRLNEMPIQNEPGYEKAKDENAKSYNRVLEWYNMEVAIVKMIENTPKEFEEFKPFMKKEFIKNCSYYEKYLNSIMEKDSYIIKSKYFGMKAKLYPISFMKKLQVIKGNYNMIEEHTESNTTNQTQETKNKPQETKKHTKKRVPNQKATLFDVGYEMKSENNNSLYVVALRKDNRKYWKRKN